MPTAETQPSPAETGAQAGAAKPHIATLYNVKKRHAKEFDDALATLGWSADRYYANAEDMDALPGKLAGGLRHPDYRSVVQL